jgi:superfamily I DNA/RNA helicase
MGLNPFQQKCVDHDGNLLITACPGSGKTTVLTHRAERLLKDFPDENLLAVTFTKDAAEELKDRIIKKIPGTENRVAAGTFHSLALNQIKRAGIKFRLLSERETVEIIQGAIDTHGLTKKYPIKSVMSHFSAIQSSANPDQHPAVISSLEIAAIWKTYKTTKQRAKAVDFADLIIMSLQKMKAGEIKPYNAKFILGDEAQDMDELQHAWINAHAENGSLITLVGDDDQSIFGFRFASGYKGMMLFMKDLKAQNNVLPINYRCGYDILKKAETLIEKNKERVDKPIKAGMDFPGSIIKPLEFEFLRRFGQDDKELTPSREPEIEGVALVIGKIKQYEEWAVLARNNDTLKKLEALCRVSKINVYREGKSIWEAPQLASFLNILNYLVNGKWFDMAILLDSFIESDELFSSESMTLTELYRIENEKKSAISAKNCIALKKIIFYERQWKQWLMEKNPDSTSKCLQDIADFTLENMKAVNKMSDSALNRTKDLLNLAVKILSERKEPDMKRRLFLETSPLIKNPGKRRDSIKENAKNENKPFVHLMTMHASKGLEFDNVWIMSADDHALLRTRFDFSRPLEINVDEERRLLYVAMTRARKTLVTSYSVFKSCPQTTLLQEADLL